MSFILTTSHAEDGEHCPVHVCCLLRGGKPEEELDLQHLQPVQALGHQLQPDVLKDQRADKCSNLQLLQGNCVLFHDCDVLWTL